MSSFAGADGEGLKLSHGNWQLEIADRCDKALARLCAASRARRACISTGKPATRICTLAIALWRRARTDKLYVKKLGLYKNKLKHLSREIERDYGLKIVSNERQPGNRRRAADRNEFEESRAASAPTA